MLKIKAKTLSRDYFIYAAIVAAVIIGISLIGTFQAYDTLHRESDERYQTEANKISEQLSESFNYLQSFMQLIANDISRLNNATPEKIAPILEKSWPRINDSNLNYLSWSVLDFSDAHGRILASSLENTSYDTTPVMLPTSRAWITQGPKQPGRLIFSQPDIGVLTKQYVMPVGFGINDKNGRYLGAISISFNLNSLERKLENPASRETSFAIIDNNKNIITQSADSAKKLPANFFESKLANEDLSKDEGKLEQPIKSDGVRYTYYKKIPNYPFVVLVGDNKFFHGREVNRLLEPRIEQGIILGLIFLGILYFFQRKIILPVKKLSDAALAISRGDDDVEMPDTDIHEYQVLSTQLGKIHEIISRLTIAQRDLEDALKAKSSFLSNMSHEFRTPLNAVIGFSETIKKKVFGDIGNEKYSEYVQDINEQGQYLLKLIEDILDASKIESGKAKLYDEPLSFQRMVKDSVRTVQQRADAKKIQIITEISDDLPYIKADKTRIKQVLLNLLSNAVKFTADKGRIYVRCFVDSEFVCEVQDTGIGIASDDLNKIAQRFAQVDNIYTRKNRGSGLGMSITKDIIELHGGTLVIESELNVGTKITVRLPKDRIIFASQYVEN